MLKLIHFLYLMQRIFENGDIQNTSLTPGALLNIFNTFLCDYIQELYSFKYGLVFSGPLCI